MNESDHNLRRSCFATCTRIVVHVVGIPTCTGTAGSARLLVLLHTDDEMTDAVINKRRAALCRST